MSREIPGRAMTYEQKREVVDKILGAWMCVPSQRLGQIIVNAIRTNPAELDQRLFFIEDEELVKKLTESISRRET